MRFRTYWNDNYKSTITTYVVIFSYVRATGLRLVMRDKAIMQTSYVFINL